MTTFQGSLSAVTGRFQAALTGGDVAYSYTENIVQHTYNEKDNNKKRFLLKKIM